MENEAPLAVSLLGRLSGNSAFVAMVEQGSFREDYAINKFSVFSALRNGSTANTAINGLEIHDATYIFPYGLSADNSIDAGIYIEFHVDRTEHIEPLRIAQILCSASEAMEILGNWELTSVDILVPAGLTSHSMWPLQYQASYLWDNFSTADHDSSDVSFELRSTGEECLHLQRNIQSLLEEISRGRVVLAEKDENPSEKIPGTQEALDSIGFYKSHMTPRCTLAFTLPNCLSVDLGLLAEISYVAYCLDCSDTCLLSFRVL